MFIEKLNIVTQIKKYFKFNLKGFFNPFGISLQIN